jgi:hypothetical protein
MHTRIRMRHLPLPLVGVGCVVALYIVNLTFLSQQKKCTLQVVVFQIKPSFHDR